MQPTSAAFSAPHCKHTLYTHTQASMSFCLGSVGMLLSGQPGPISKRILTVSASSTAQLTKPFLWSCQPCFFIQRSCTSVCPRHAITARIHKPLSGAVHPTVFNPPPHMCMTQVLISGEHAVCHMQVVHGRRHVGILGLSPVGNYAVRCGT